ncbi:hypothetical protein F5890DRAFT_1406849 [Lentinula detonsa]|uniref:Uncharacterized protein n=1 Tax=Lentinula detonsa TaxID=2804962 RepID=A0AA38Q3J7_9AGAR|nr:hypothetical protein F5890DRAFT_1406849 [Lentinula detonsa]
MSGSIFTAKFYLLQSTLFQDSVAGPKVFTFLKKTTFLSVKTPKMVENILNKSNDRNPDVHDMLIYNEHGDLGAFVLIEEHFEKIMKYVAKKNWDAVYVLLDGFIIYIHRPCPAPTDTSAIEREHGLLRLHGACLMTMFRELDKQGRLNTQNFPGLEYFLRYTIQWIEHAKDRLVGIFHLGSDILPHLNVCKAIAYRLFKNQTVEDLNLHLTRIREWVQWLEPRVTEDDHDYAGTKVWVQDCLIREWPWLLLGVKPWYLEGRDHHVSKKGLELNLEEEWSTFSDYRKENPLVPPKGLSWEFKDWSEEEREAHRGETVYEPSDEEEGDDDDSSDTESMGWGMERSFWKM